ncbi:restriction endonuclease subunit S [Streptomyces somaliensis]|uniref:restriction endonuclease subunit S n=1 Tax=Streptomyces somaliensis TaxID=78355 RepID=UPI0020CF08C0|nr:restriction endonuclease subunit S [Streptomyces somaliensis]MCP9945111.1 restriction endonuclease subunit S [Streptomyces somaliensis]MCP9961674.1 restriction endonuclease subunit S [Streptomyces somaliensis]MCP9974487.1 restriction endonuclease subunit S [Streptomyces somaliensis]
MGVHEWKTRPLGEVVALQRGFELSKEQRITGDVPVVGASGIVGWHNKAMTPGPGVTLGRAGAMGHATYVPQDYWPLNTALFVTNFFGNDSLYIYYLLHSIDFTAYNSGGVQPMLNRNYIKDVRVVIPEPPEQQAIAEVLGALDDKIALNEQMRETILSLADACYQSAQVSDETELIGNLAELYDGPHATPQKTESGPWFLSISSLKNGYLDLSESAHLSEEDFPRWTRRVQPQAGDVLFSYETRLGDAALMPPGVRGSLGRRMALLRSKSANVSGALLLHAYLSPPFQEEIKRRTVYGATVDRLPLKEMPGWRISLPAAGERERLSAKLDALHASVTQTANENRTLAELRDTLLPQLLSGKLRVKDAVRTVEEVV